MKFSVYFENDEWVVSVFENIEDNEPIDIFEIDNIDDAIEAVAELLEEVRSDADPLAEIFDEEA